MQVDAEDFCPGRVHSEVDLTNRRIALVGANFALQGFEFEST